MRQVKLFLFQEGTGVVPDRQGEVGQNQTQPPYCSPFLRCLLGVHKGIGVLTHSHCHLNVLYKVNSAIGALEFLMIVKGMRATLVKSSSLF